MEDTKIEIKVKLDENRVPEKIHWSASDGGVNNESADAMVISLWDSKNFDTLRIDLWTKEMQVDQMKKFMHQTLLSLSKTYERATNDEELAKDMQDFCAYFEEKANLKK